MTKAKTVEYKDIKGHLKENFKKFIANPIEFGVDAEAAATITNMNSLKAKGLWKLFKHQLKIKLEDLKLNDLADTLIGDLEEDHVLVASKDTLARILANPEDARYELEEDMILEIRSMSASAKKELRDQVGQKLHLGDFDEHAELTIGQKILRFLKELWVKIAPVIDKIFEVAVDMGVKALTKVIGEKVEDSALAEALENGVEGLADAVKDLGNEKENSATPSEAVDLTGNETVDSTVES